MTTLTWSGGARGKLEELRRRLAAKAVWHTQACRFLLPITFRTTWKALPGTSRSWGPPRNWASRTGYVQAPECEWWNVFDAARGEYDRPFWPENGQTPFEGGRHYHWPEQGVAVVPNARVISCDGWCVGVDDTFLGEFCYGGNRRASWVYALRFLNRPTPLAGMTLNLCSQYSALNFYHWMIDGVARLELLQRANFPFHEIDQILLPQFRSATADWVIDRLGLTGVKVIHPGPKDQYECELLVQPSYPGELQRCPPWPIEFYRKHFPAPQVPRTRKIYLPRRGSRGLVNETEVEQLLTAHGFEAFEPAGRTNLHVELADVSHVVAVHGAGMTNLVFCRPGTRVLELMPSDMQFPFFYSLCSSGQMPYGVVVGPSLRNRSFKVQKATHSPFRVPVPELRSALSALLNSAPSTADAFDTRARPIRVTEV